jgi:HSP20 family protein
MATLVRWEPFRELAGLQNEMSRFMNGLFEGNGQPTQAWVPTLDAWETDTEIVYALDLPGVSKDKISIELDEGALTISAERERSDEVKRDSFYRFERRFGTFTRTVGVPHGTAEADVTASYEAGVLQLHVRKPEQPKPRKIEIGGNGNKDQAIEGTATESA